MHWTAASGPPAQRLPRSPHDQVFPNEDENGFIVASPAAPLLSPPQQTNSRLAGDPLQGLVKHRRHRRDRNVTPPRQAKSGLVKDPGDRRDRKTLP